MKKEDKIQYNLSIWVLLLRFIAGYLNVMTFVLFAQMLTGHTGTITRAAMLLADGDLDAMLRSLAVVTSFFLGTIVSGYFYPTDKFNPKLQYGVFLIVMGIILLTFNYIGYHSIWFLLYITFTLGMQNAMFVFYKGLVVRTTILTGTVTDIGVGLGRKLKGMTKDAWKIRFHIVNVLCFMIGAVVAMLIHLNTDWSLVFIAGLFDIVIGLYFYFMRDDLIETIRDSLIQS